MVLCIKDVRTEIPSVLPQLDVNVSGPVLLGPALSLLLISVCFSMLPLFKNRF